MELVVKTFAELTLPELYEVLRVRSQVFVVEQQCAYQDIDGLDQASLHLFLREDGQIAAYLRLFDKPGEPGVVQIGRVLTVRRGAGLGGRLLREGIRLAGERMGARALFLEAQVYARGFYAREGFAPSSEEFLEDGIPHVEMRRKL